MFHDKRRGLLKRGVLKRVQSINYGKYDKDLSDQLEF